MKALAVGSSADGSETRGFPQAKMNGSRSMYPWTGRNDDLVILSDEEARHIL